MSIEWEFPKEPYRLVVKPKDGREEIYTFEFKEEGGGIRVIVDYAFLDVNAAILDRGRFCRTFDKHYAPFDLDSLRDDWKACGLGQFCYFFTYLHSLPLRCMEEVLDGKLYKTETSDLLASAGPVWGWKFDWKEYFLFRTPQGDYFLQHQDGRRDIDSITPLSVSEAIEVYKMLPNKRVPFEEAFPGVKAEEV